MKKPKLTAEYVRSLSKAFAEICSDWSPFDYQKEIFDDLFIKQKKEVFCNLTRKGGKSQIAIAFLSVKAQLRPNSILYYISFEKNNAKQTVWMRFKQMVPREWLQPHAFKETNLEIHFANGSVIYLLGSNMNTDALIGTTPDSVVYDEFRAHKQDFHDVMRPNTIVHDHCQSLYISTPPDQLDVESGRCRFYVDQMKYCQTSPNCSYHHIPCWKANPNLQDAYKAEYHKALQCGRLAEFQREYEAAFVKGSSDSIMPEFSEVDLIPHEDIMAMVRYIKKPIWVIGNDTSGLSRYGHLFMVIDKDTSEIYVLDAITRKCRSGGDRHEREIAKMTGKLLWPDLEAKMKELCPGSSHEDWNIVWDCHDVPIVDDVHRWHGDNIDIIMVNKRRMSKEQSYGLIRDLKTLNKIHIGSRASELIDEMKCYHIEAGKDTPKKTYDELIDCLRYSLYEYDYLFDADALKSPIIDNMSAEQKFLRSLEEFGARQDQKIIGSYLVYDDYD